MSAPTATDPRKGPDIPALTGLRGVAAIWVVLFHRHMNDHAGSEPIWIALRHGYLAVDVFFVLSGYVMALSYGRMFAAGLRFDVYRTFLLRRVARIYPVYLVVTLAVYFSPLVNPDGLAQAFSGAQLRWLAVNLAMVQSWGFSSPFIGPTWSISTETVAYLLFGLLALASLYRRQHWALAVGLGCWLGALALTTLVAPPSFPRWGPLDVAWGHAPWPLVRCLAEFTLGLATYRVGQTRQMAAIVRTRAVPWAVAVAAVALLFFPGTDLAFLALIPCGILVLALDDGPVTRFFCLKPVLVAGELSYSIYLIHAPLLNLRHLGRALHSDVAGLVLFYAVLVAAAWACFRFIEEPGRRLVRSWEPAMSGGTLSAAIATALRSLADRLAPPEPTGDALYRSLADTTEDQDPAPSARSG